MFTVAVHETTGCAVAADPCATMVIPLTAAASSKNGRLLYSVTYLSAAQRLFPTRGHVSLSTVSGEAFAFDYQECLLGELASSGAASGSAAAEKWVQLNPTADPLVVQLKLRKLTLDRDRPEYGIERLVIHVDVGDKNKALAI